jgi:hypothetical protein
MELGLGHGVGFGDSSAPWGSEKLGKTGHPSGLYNSYPIPFGKSIRVTAQRAQDAPDGASMPTLLSSGLEDYSLGTYYFNRGRYANGLAGLTHLDTKNNTFSAYRFHDNDPVFFQKGLRLTCCCGEELNGQKLHDPPDTRFTT